MSFRQAFEGKAVYLAENLEVTLELLRRLKDKKIILQSHVNRINNIPDNGAKVDVLLEILQRRPDSMFPEFCAALEAEDQPAIAKSLNQPNYQWLR